jgi:uncharacterized protein (TIGR00251 family)
MRIEQSAADVLLWVKAVPGASRNQIAGPLGDRLKIRVSAPAEGGKANKAICALIADALGLKSRDVQIETGHSSADKTVRIHNASISHIVVALQGT